MENTNPLNKYFRQPAVYISLPSGGAYPPHVLTPSTSGEYGVMPMTAKDEIRFKTPDALMNGEGVVEVIQSCIPDIKDAWQVKAHDLDTILIAIRIATYGETMDIKFTVPGSNEEAEHSLNLPALLENIRLKQIQNEFTLDDGMKISVNPLTYRDMTKASLQTFQQTKMYNAVQSSEIEDEQKLKRFNDAFKSLTELNSSILLKNIAKITTPEGAEVTDPAQIKEFVEKANTTLIKQIEEKLAVFRSQGAVEPVKLKATKEQIEKGAPATYEVPVTFDSANFFV
jgi:hypothetical protein|tara:strand:- start:128 stop:979 length:852 start_codon:yes stop_codon:yes gene_type:complete